MKQFDPQETLNLRIQHKRATRDEWKDEEALVPLDGELIIVTDQDVTYVLVGDGTNTVTDLIEKRAIKLGAISKQEAISNEFIINLFNK